MSLFGFQIKGRSDTEEHFNCVFYWIMYQSYLQLNYNFNLVHTVVDIVMTIDLMACQIMKIIIKKKKILYKNVSIHACLTIKLLSSLLQIDLNSINYCLSGKNAFLLEFCLGLNLSNYYFHSFLNIFFEFFLLFERFIVLTF